MTSTPRHRAEPRPLLHPDGWLRASVLDAFALVLPVQCAACSAPGRSLCAECASALQPRLHRFELPGAGGAIPVTAAVRYDGAARATLLAFKANARTDVAPHLAAALEAALAAALQPVIAAAPAECEIVTPPSTRAAMRTRGYDPVAVLCARVGVRRARVVRATRAGRSQKTLDRAERSDNRAFSFAARGNLAGRHFVIVDDIVTTGATIGELARAVSAAGGTVHAAVALAWTAKESPSREPSVTSP